MKKIFSFDLGSGSLGECVRDGEEIKYLNSLLLDPEFAAIDEQRIQRRGFRTRQAHRAREQWWRTCAKEAGLEVLQSAQPTLDGTNAVPDERMLREFAKKGDDTLYTSCLLRIALLQGRKLLPWQVYKAVWSALQHRGYDAHVPWGSDAKRIEHKREAGEELTAREKKILQDMQKEAASSNLYMQAVQALPEEYRYPCYYEAWKLGLWDFSQPEVLQRELCPYPIAARNKEGTESLVAPRKLVEKELLALLQKAAEQYPALKGREMFVLYGPSQKAYAAVTDRAAYGQYRGKEWEWQGILGQKTPRFDNRALLSCRLIPRFHVCKAEAKINLEAVFLLNLKNMRFTLGNDTAAFLSAAQIREVYEQYLPDLQKSSQNIIGKRDWGKIVKKYGGVANENQNTVPMPAKTGRSRFSKPALKLLKELILSGQNPHEFYRQKTTQLTNTEPKKGLVKEDFFFLLAMPNEWKKIHIADRREEEKELSAAERKEEINKLLGNIKNTVVRHRLLFFWQELQRLEKQYGVPDEIVLEVVRSDFFSDAQKMAFIRRQKENQRLNAQLAAEAGEQNVTKMKLFKEQNGIDLYDTSANRHLEVTALSEYDIDHIVPQARGGADSYVNKVLTKHSLNLAKGNKTPYEWLNADSGKWSEYLANIKQCRKKDGISDYKLELLISDEAADMEKRRTDLQATAYLEKLAQRVAALHFGWAMNAKDEKRRIFVASGAQTAHVRRIFRLDKLLYKPEDFENYKTQGILEEKNRANKRHHALDSLVLSIIREIHYNPDTNRLQGPAFFTPPFCHKALSKVYPQEVRTVKPKLRDTIYGLRERIVDGKKQYFIVTRFNSSVANFQKLTEAKKLAKDIFDPDLKKQITDKLHEAGLTQEAWQQWLDAWSDHGRRIRKMTKLESGPFTEKDILIKNGRRQIGCFYELGKMKGQFLTNKEQHKGQIVYKDAKGKWRVDPVYLWESLPQKLAQAKQRCGRALFFKSGQLIEVQEDVGKVKKGVYQLRTILTATGATKIVSLDTQQMEHPNIGKLLDIGKMRHFKPKSV